MMKISGYTTVRNPVEMDYPFEAAVRSLFPFCDEIVVCDTSDGKDGTEKILKGLKQEFEAIDKWANEFKVVKPDFVDWSAPNHGIYDGMCKAFARDNCTGEYCFQIDADEVVATTREHMENMCQRLDDETPLMALPVVEYWGSQGKVRIDVNPWKWRLSKNQDHITHGIPAGMRQEVDGLLYARPGTDGCDYVSKGFSKVIPCMHFVPPQVEQVRRQAVLDPEAVSTYEKWFNKITDRLPTVYHFSWWSVYAKMQKYRLFWNDSWQSLYNEKRPPGYNPFFDKPLDQVSDEEMRAMAKKLEEETGGFIFHSPYDGSKTNHVTIHKPFPEIAQEWAEEHKS